jgi:hypothetical protein
MYWAENSFVVFVTFKYYSQGVRQGNGNGNGNINGNDNLQLQQMLTQVSLLAFLQLQLAAPQQPQTLRC